MQLHNDPEAAPLHEYNERTEYMASPHYYFQYPQAGRERMGAPMPDYAPTSHRHQSFTNSSPLSDARFAAILSYSFGWLTGLLFTLFGGQNRFMRFHALQSLVFFGMINLIDAGLFTMMRVGWHHNHILLFVSILFFLLLNFIAFVTWIVAMVQVARGMYFKLPFVGEWVAHHFNTRATPLW